MVDRQKSALQVYEDEVALKFELFNSLFLTLPFSPLHRYGAQLPVFAKYCEKFLEKGASPERIVSHFFREVLHIEDADEQARVLFLFLQQIERQVLLFDAIEESAQPQLVSQHSNQLLDQLREHLKPGCKLRIVLTAHPTQFYPDYLLHTIHELSEAAKETNVGDVRNLLLQLGRTSFRNAVPPTPLSEAQMLIEHFGSVFYNTFLDLLDGWEGSNQPGLEIGFWPGGDRDGHPLVDVLTTKEVAKCLRDCALSHYIRDFQEIRRRITFKGCLERVEAVHRKLQAAFHGDGGYRSADQLVLDLVDLKAFVEEKHRGLFVSHIDRLLLAVGTFGFFFARLDLRQSSMVIAEAIGTFFDPHNVDYLSLSVDQRWRVLEERWESADDRFTATDFSDPVVEDLVNVLRLVPEIHEQNGSDALHRFIISHTEHALDVLGILFLAQKINAEDVASTLDFVPLFESINAMQAAPEILQKLLACSLYRKHLKTRGDQLTVMLGFSDGTKDGGYVTCNWEIQRCKEKLCLIAEQYNIEILFFDGRGGPPARGGGAAHRYYRGVAETLPLSQLQLTVQGQTISSYYGTPTVAKQNILQLMSSMLIKPKKATPPKLPLLEELSKRAHGHYLRLRQMPKFIQCLSEATPLSFFNVLNIASRPPKRSSGQLSLESLRAIPFVGSWSLMKVNIPAFYGLGKALEEMAAEGQQEALKELALTSTYFSTLLGNASQALRKSYLPLTRYLCEDSTYGPLWQDVCDEARRSTERVIELLDQTHLLADDPLVERSVALREKIILPLLVIQHDALIRRRLELQDRSKCQVFDKMILKSIPPSINASRNSA